MGRREGKERDRTLRCRNVETNGASAMPDAERGRLMTSVLSCSPLFGCCFFGFFLVGCLLSAEALAIFVGSLDFLLMTSSRLLTDLTQASYVGTLIEHNHAMPLNKETAVAENR